MVEPTNIAARLRALSADMIALGVEMNYYGGLSEIAQYGKELIGAGHLAAEWARGIEAMNQRAANAWADVPDAAAWLDELRGNTELRA